MLHNFFGRPLNPFRLPNGVIMFFSILTVTEITYFSSQFQSANLSRFAGFSSEIIPVVNFFIVKSNKNI